MTKRQLSIALVAFAATALLTAGFAQAFTVKDSADFGYGYEASSGLPTTEDTATGWTKIGAAGTYGVAGGLLNYDTGPAALSGQWFATTAGGGWGSTVTPGTSYTVEFAAQITWGIDAVPGLHTIFDNSSERIWLNVAPDHVAIGNGSLETQVLLNSVNDTALHTYRLAFDATTDLFHVWRDGVSIGSDLAATTTSTAVSMSFGDASSTGSGAGSIDYYRWDATGAYAPLQPVKDSADFAYKYEATSDLPTVEDSGAGKTNWAFFDHPSIDANFQVAGGELSYSSMPDALAGEWFYSNASVTDSAWAANVDADTSFTAEFSARVTADVGDVPGLHTIFDNGTERIFLTIATDHVAVGDGNTEGTVLAAALDNSTDFHTYRIAFDATTDLFEVWRDGISIGEVGSQSVTAGSSVSFGDATSRGSATAEIDYMRWDATGAYAPVPEPTSLALLAAFAGAMLLLRGRRRG